MTKIILFVLFLIAVNADFPSICDFIIVGAGSAGSFFAEQISRNSSLTVCVIDQGIDQNDSPYTVPGFYGPSTVPDFNPLIENGYSQENQLAGYRSQWFPLPRDALGGDSALNGNIYGRNTNHSWNYVKNVLGIHGWGADDIEPLWIEHETYIGPDPTDGHGHSGPIINQQFAPDSTLTTIMHSLSAVTGLPIVPDLNLGSAHGISISSRNIALNGTTPVRQDAWNKVLQPVLNRTNLYLLTGARVNKIDFLHGIARTVHWSTGDGCGVTYASERIVLSTGTIRSSQLLQVSGVGDCTYLATLGIDCVYNNTNVGSNLRDRIAVPVFVWVGLTPVPIQPLGCIPISYLHLDPTQLKPDFEIAFTTVLSGGAQLYIFELVQLHHDSVGKVQIQSTLPNQIPHVEFDFYQANPNNTQAMITAIRIVFETMANQSAPYIQVVPDPCVLNIASSDAEILSFIQSNYIDYYHYVGTSSLGKVVDENCEVYGVKHLLVVDNGIMPIQYSEHAGFSSAAMIGLNCARKIKAKYGF